MDIKDLRSRIDSIKQQTNGSVHTGKSQREKKPRPDAGKTLLDNGWNRISEMVYEKVSVINNILPEAVSDILLDESCNTAENKTMIPAENFVFYDTETTGLSAGAGNIVFLAGFGFLETSNDETTTGKPYFKIIQLFLSDFPGEPAFLERMKKYITPDRIYVSYNGKSFDANILRSRYAMNAMQIDFGYQLDLLYSSRRLWKNIIGACSLGDIEREVLDKRRALDVPGFMVPDLYFDFIRTARWDTIEGVNAHHLEDISSLAELLAVHEQLFAEAGEHILPGNYKPAEYIDALGLASLLADKRPEKAALVLSSAFKGGNHKAGAGLSIIHKRAGRWDDAVIIWNRLWDDGKSIFAAVELAKYYEHRAHNIEKALGITNDVLGLERFRITGIKQELEKRKKRLITKLN